MTSTPSASNASTLRKALGPGCVALSFALCAIDLHAQASGVVSGVVTDLTGAPISGAEVTIPSSGTIARTDDQGRFRIGATVGVVTINARRMGFEPGSRQVQLGGSNEALNVTIPLKSLPSVLKPVVVRTSKVDYTGRLAGYYRRLENRNVGYFITRDDIDRENARTLTQLLTHIPAINATRMRAGGTGVRMRGRQCWPLVWLDGLPMGAAEVDLDAFAPSSIQGIELYLGATTAPMRYMANRDQSSCGTILLWSRGPDTDPVTKQVRPRFDLERMVASFKVYTADQVDTPAIPAPHSQMNVDYPAAVFAEGDGGSVVAEFVVDSTGNVEDGTFGIVSSTDPLLSDAVRRAVEASIYIPAKLKGTSVRQVVVQPFAFPARQKKKSRG